jgi:hypothetical protein
VLDIEPTPQGGARRGGRPTGEEQSRRPTHRGHHLRQRRLPSGRGLDRGAVDGTSSLATGGDDITDLSQVAERLRSEAIGFLVEMRR